ncbi:hypothetical protein [Flagellimonas pacifica]|uniref:Uncharacterized protein n=1 Tax=Flagellimonas pacifica TaxID=1247520 RepID=A0A285MXB0_9FLAO|nr:hypothetical protein [Allomuricauda parva]SNZ01187.1 hypothetical protein SAMN06265377_3023 [Allomuricauda parva]
MTKSNNILKLLESLGYLFPTDPESITEFEKRYKKEIAQIQPKHWDNPLEILQKGRTEQLPIEKEVENPSYEGLAQAARHGKTIPVEMKKKMLEDRNNAKD